MLQCLSYPVLEGYIERIDYIAMQANSLWHYAEGLKLELINKMAMPKSLLKKKNIFIPGEDDETI